MHDGPHLSILGTRGIPACHGGFETFAEELALFLVSRGWSVTVYCQTDGARSWSEDAWRGVKLVKVPTRLHGPAGAVEFDCRSCAHALVERKQLLLTLGYNTAFLAFFYRLAGRTNIFNMDGMEWRRSKWSAPIKAWFYLNEHLGCHFGNHLIADHPEIALHLATRVRADKITMIPYGSPVVANSDNDDLEQFSLQEQEYALVIARPEPENSILEIVTAFRHRPRRIMLVVVGVSTASEHAYERAVRAAAGENVKFLGAVYDKKKISTLRARALFYVHGHQVGGTNPSLVEALGAGCVILAHDNKFNRWVAGPSARYFGNTHSCEREITTLLQNAPTAMQAMRDASRARHAQSFQWEPVLSAYEDLLIKFWRKTTDRDRARVSKSSA